MQMVEKFKLKFEHITGRKKSSKGIKESDELAVYLASEEVCSEKNIQLCEDRTVQGTARNTVLYAAETPGRTTGKRGEKNS